ncbi:MAG: HDOD domain-containing protein [Proteobacteria bacterium]|nr:HDOD domain-containing protein [Pseudomonadota bacterium]
MNKRITVRSILLILLASPQLAMAISQSFNSKDCPAFDAARFWLQSLMTAECCKKIAAADKQADDVIRDLAYSAGLCHNIGLMVLAHLEPARTNAILAAHRKHTEPGGLSKTFMSEFATDHRDMTSEPASINWLKHFKLTWTDCRRWP